MNFLYSVEREFAHSVQRVWQAWTEASELEQWYHPTDLLNVPDTTVSDAQVGGWWTVAVDVPAHGFVAYFFGQYTAVEIEERLEHSMHFVSSREDFDARDLTSPAATVVVEFAPTSTGATVKFSQFGEMPEDQIPRTKAGMESYFQSLADFLG
jgi:uncharacterized protein YndB with AHSA1/START domain